MLFTIDTRPFEASLRQAQANVSKDLALKKQAEANLAKDLAQSKYGDIEAKRYATLVEQGVVSREQYDQIRSNAESLKATVEADKAAIHSAEESIKVDTAAVDSAKVELSYCYIRSPIDGRAGQRFPENVEMLSETPPARHQASAWRVLRSRSSARQGNSHCRWRAPSRLIPRVTPCTKSASSGRGSEVT